MALQIVIMAAGQGTRMKSARPKVLHSLGGSSLLQHVLRLAAALGPVRTVVVTGHGADDVEAEVARLGLPGVDTRCVRQFPQRGTGHAVQQTLPMLDAGVPITLVLNGDVPLVQPETARSLAAACAGEALALLTVNLADPAGYGRIVRGMPDIAPDGTAGDAPGGTVRAIVEHRDASDAQRAIREVYTGILAAPTARLAEWVMALRDDNAQGELYLTDIVAMAVSQGVPVRAVQAADETEVLGVNSPAQLAALERRLQRRHADAALEQGVRLADPDRFDLRGTLTCGRDVEIDVGCIFEGEVTLGEGVRVGAHCVVRDTHIAAGAVVHPYSHLDGAHVGPGALVGPYARLRPGAELGPEVHIGNFVEVKNATLARGAKANHLAYLGDATVGERVNFGAGSITANYDGANKHRTVIGDDVHVGSNCVLIAPITVGEGATIGGGSTVALKVPAGQLTVARAPSRTIAGWKRPAKRG